ncbi:translation initiation factor IF-2 N-terminal domain-containing protein [uncultured Lactococcus sp.]|uniref:translation initiation factor IF-2 N-terminal domain-containing protein n=1 Tax=uncultured Lactococcus sp. TaxID=167973 RepID=UPI0027DB1A4C|nr:translation initiation factor IF-2 N-terminal domain-containing protein [uncultured Lactococcus sp.]
MKIYELARDLGVDQEALLFLAQKEGLEVKSVASMLTEDEKEQLLQAFDESGGVLEISEISPQKVKKKQEKKVKKKSSFVSDVVGQIKKYEPPPKKTKVPQVKAVKEKTAYRIYRVVLVGVVALFVGLGYSAYNANVQMTDLTTKVNQTTETLSENQKELSEQMKILTQENKSLSERVKKLEKSSSTKEVKKSLTSQKVEAKSKTKK